MNPEITHVPLNPRGQFRRVPLQRRDHTDFGSGIPYYDEELDLAHSIAHQNAISFLLPIFDWLALEAGLICLSDHPTWYIDPDTETQKWFSFDLGFAGLLDYDRYIADDVQLAMEVVSIDDPRKEHKDRVLRRRLNEYNEVPEFVLYYPELEDSRALEWFRLDVRSGYRPIKPKTNGRFQAVRIPELELAVLPRPEWKSGRKLAVFWKGERIGDFASERAERLRLEAELAALKRKQHES